MSAMPRPHEAFDRDDRVGAVERGIGKRCRADQALAFWQYVRGRRITRPESSGRQSATPCRTRPRSEWRGAEVDADRAGRDVVRVGGATGFGNLDKAMSLLSQRFEAPIDVVGKALDEHEGLTCCAAAGVARESRACAAHVRARRFECANFVGDRFDRPAVRVVEPSRHSTAASEPGRHRGVVPGLIGAPAVRTGSGALDRIFNR